MNKVYKLVWSKVRNCYVAVSEMAKSRGKSSVSGLVGKTLVVGILACVISSGVAAPVFAYKITAGAPIVTPDPPTPPDLFPTYGATGTDSFVLGNTALASGDGAYAIGGYSIASGNAAYVFGQRAKASAQSDDEGIPRFTAGGGKADIDCEGNNVKGIVEVTLMTGAAQQTEHEVPSIEDHLTDIEERTEKFTMALFVAPIFQRRALKYLSYLNDKYHNQKSNQGGIIPMLISEMIPKFKDTIHFRDLSN